MFEHNLAKQNPYELELELKHNVDKAQMSKFRRCPKCRHNWLVDAADVTHEQLFGMTRCMQPLCWHEFCKKCLQPWRSLKIDCQNKCANCKEISIVKNDEFWENKKQAIIQRHCHKCSRQITNNGGSNHVFCSFCHSNMCFICREPNVYLSKVFQNL